MTWFHLQMEIVSSLNRNKLNESRNRIITDKIQIDYENTRKQYVYIKYQKK